MCEEAFVLWITGLPASGKSTLAGAVVRALAARGVDAITLESDALRRIYTPRPDWSQTERERFYETVGRLAATLARAGVPSIIDATGSRRAWRDAVRAQVRHFAEVWVDTPIDVCAARDPKGLYLAATQGRAPTLPGVGSAYEPPLAAEVIIDSASDPESGAGRVIAALEDRGFVARRHPGVTVPSP